MPGDPTPPPGTPTVAPGPDYEAEMDIPGRITWHSSEEGGGPDVGISLGLGDKRILWAGEISDSLRGEAEENAALGGPVGWWLILYDPAPVAIARCAGEEQARALLDRLELVMRDTAARLAAVTAERDALLAANAILREHVANIHNRVRHTLSAEIEAASNKAFGAMVGISVLREARTALAPETAP